MNTYEAMLLNDDKALKETIIYFIKTTINEKEGAVEELRKIQEVIDFNYSIECKASFLPYNDVMIGTKKFNTINDYWVADKEVSDICYDECNVEWDEDISCGVFSMDNGYEVEVEIIGLTENASEEARKAREELIKMHKEGITKQVIKMLRKKAEELEAALN